MFIIRFPFIFCRRYPNPSREYILVHTLIHKFVCVSFFHLGQSNLPITHLLLLTRICHFFSFRNNDLLALTVRIVYPAVFLIKVSATNEEQRYMEVIDHSVKPSIQIIFRQNIHLRHALEEMAQYNQYTGITFTSSTHFSLVLATGFSLITSSPSAVRYQHPRFPRRSYASTAPCSPHSDRC